jgi:hypothetical protein
MEEESERVIIITHKRFCTKLIRVNGKLELYDIMSRIKVLLRYAVRSSVRMHRTVWYIIVGSARLSLYEMMSSK